MVTNPDRDELSEGDEQDEIERRSIFSAGWFRALIVLTVLAIVVVISLPYLLNWLEPTPPPPARIQAKSSAPAGKTDEPASAPAAPAPAKPSPAERPIGAVPAPVVPAPSPPAAKAGRATPSAPATRRAPATQAEASKSASAPRQGGAPEGGSPGSYWVQVGAFVESRNAEALAKRLRAESFPVHVSTVTRAGAAVQSAEKTSGGQNQLFITDSSTDAVDAALKGKGTAQVVQGGVQVNPPYDLETAMTLSSSLKKEGFKVVIRRLKGGTPTTAAGGGTTFHIVRVGAYADRSKAQQARGELESKGHQGGFLTQGAAR